MNTFLWSCAALLAVFVTAESLTCNTCDVSILGSCFLKTPVDCPTNQNMCYSGVADFSAVLLSVHALGCIQASACLNETNKPILTITYNVTRHCCTTDLCNGAASIQLPPTAALGAALLALWSQWGL